MFYHVLAEKDIMLDAAPCHECSLIGADDRPEYKFESTTDKFGDPFIDNIAARDGPIDLFSGILESVFIISSSEKDSESRF